MKWNKLFTLIFVSLFWACSDDDKTAGGTTEDAGIIADLNVAGVAQKGPFVKGSAVTVQGIDCKTMELTGERFESTVKSDKGDYDVSSINLSSPCAVFEVSGYYLNEVTGVKSADKITLRTITNLKDRKNVNVNVLTHLEYDRVMYLVTVNKMLLADAKKQAEKEALATFGIDDGAAYKVQTFEDLNMFEKSEGGAALLAVSVIMQGDESTEELAKRLEKFAYDFAEDGEWNDGKAKKEIAEWAATATENGKLDTIRKNVESMNGGNKVAAFETYVSAVIPDSVENPRSSSSSVKKSSSSGFDWSLSKEAYLNQSVKYDSIVDARDGNVYKTVKIGNQTWMAENLNYADSTQTPSLLGNNWCYEDDPQKCKVVGRLYSWTAAIDSVKLASNDTKADAPQECGMFKQCTLPYQLQGICPDGYHLPDTTEWSILLASIGEKNHYGDLLKSQIGWDYGEYADEYGFSVIYAGDRYRDGTYSYGRMSSDFWTAEQYQGNDGALAHTYNMVAITSSFKDCGKYVRCVKNEIVPQTQSSLPVCKTATEDNCEYGSLTDARDGQTYRTVKIGEQTWMAENLNYADSTQTPSLLNRNWCYGNNPENCKTYGRLYSWTAAIDSVKLSQDPDDPLDCGYGKRCFLWGRVQGICPEGYHLPDTTEWSTLVAAVGGWNNAGKVLKSQVGWPYFKGSDDYGFSALAGGIRHHNKDFEAIDGSTYFWASTEKTSENTAQVYSIHIGNNRINSFVDGYKDNGYSIRCIKD
ncbi:fibrobacter succinogenes major paralogous domain-containing protein [Fibrobacter sp. UWB12]|uniref:fibrobacter succinogenes major paralogous domain-containing protein n=1 Tax=Fibrobacter sp. UWB12 TaxID=1896203 RepID=UPI00091271B2|nr:fibrobacter succinogenes major paralogous domain-containing protein [Fibrobacter sp. UWB12]SHK80050.1 major paralogous domain-containing protein [Fibrobacter sp. UWB12]